MTNQEYWQERSLKQLAENEKDAAKVLKRMNAVYDDIMQSINADVSALYGRFSKVNGINPADVEQFLSQSEYKAWRKTIGEYMEAIKAVGIDTPEGQALWLEVEVLSTKTRVTRLEALKASILANTAKLAATEQVEVQGHLEETFQDDYYDNMYEFYRESNPEVIQAMEAGGVAIQNRDVLAIVSQPWSGADFSSRIWKNGFLTGERLTAITAQALLAGKAPKRIAKDIEQQIGVSKKNAERLILTETAHVKTEADLKSYEAAGLDKVKFIATLDTRTCHDGCAQLDGKLFAMDELKPGVNKPPLHPRCRCLLLPHNDWLESAHKKYGSRAARDKDGKTITVDADMSYDDWKKEYVEKPLKGTASKGKKPGKPTDNPKYKALSGIYNTTDAKTTDNIIRILDDGVNPNVAKCYYKYGEHLKFIDTNNDGGAYCINPSNMDRFKEKGGVHINLAKDAEGADGRPPYTVCMHELGHNLDNYLGLKYQPKSGGSAYVSTNYKNGALADALEEQWESYYLAYATREKSVREQLLDEFLGTTETFRRDSYSLYLRYVEADMRANDRSSYSKLRRKVNNPDTPLEELSRLFDDKILKWEREQGAHRADYEKSPLGPLDEIRRAEWEEHVKQKIESVVYKDGDVNLERAYPIHSITDMIGGLTEGRVVAGFCHLPDYWQTQWYRKSMATEFFAEYCEGMTNPKTIEQTRKAFPRAVEIMEEILDEYGKTKD